MTVGDKLKRARDANWPKIEQGQMAALLGKDSEGKPHTRSQVANWETNRTKVPSEIVRRYAEILSVSYRWFYDPADNAPVKSSDPIGEQSAQVSEFQPKQLYRRALRYIPVLATITAGDPWMQNAEVEWEEIPDWGGDLERWGRTVEGESMLPILRPGDVAIFENRRAEVNHVVHAFADGEDTVKCLRGQPDDPRLAPFNPDYNDFSAAGWSAKGVCVARIRIGPFRTRSYTEFPGGLSWAMRDVEV